MNSELREKEGIKDYHLKRAIIYSLIISAIISISFGLFLIAIFVCDSNSPIPGIPPVVGEILLLIFVSLAIYHSTKSWKAYKECQELANFSLATETERERER